MKKKKLKLDFKKDVISNLQARSILGGIADEEATVPSGTLTLVTKMTCPDTNPVSKPCIA